ncbi:unnamed protein product [Effrenium voratum]|uniref:Uncharacterized protein n=1 Tax=Effrenium voratum TaxID=2562239 RepID=A0AA36MPR3_9DINO|nr:unnamed protein product [Effrenium voratum]
MEVDGAVHSTGPRLVRAAMRRTARCLMDGQARERAQERMAAKEAEAVAAIAEKSGSPRDGTLRNAKSAAPISVVELEALAPDQGFAQARLAAEKIHEILGKLKAAKQQNSDDAASFEDCSLRLQKQLLSLRRAHRAMIKFSEQGRMAEVSARKVTETEFANLQTRKYESSVCRAAAGRCRYLLTPELDKLRPLVSGFQAKEDAKVSESEKAGLLTGLIHAELQERISLEEQLKGLEQQKQSEQQKLTDRVKAGAHLTSRMGTLKRALEPLRSLLQGDEPGKEDKAKAANAPEEAEKTGDGAAEPPAKRLKEAEAAERMRADAAEVEANRRGALRELEEFRRQSQLWAAEQGAAEADSSRLLAANEALTKENEELCCRLQTMAPKSDTEEAYLAAINAAEQWVLYHAGMPLEGSSMPYLRGVTVYFQEFSASLVPLVLATNPRQLRSAAAAVESCELARATLQCFRLCDAQCCGYLSWDAEEVCDLVHAVFQRKGLPTPSKDLQHLMFTKFDEDLSGRLCAQDCLCLVDALFRAVLSSPAAVSARMTEQAPEGPIVSPGSDLSGLPGKWTSWHSHACSGDSKRMLVASSV